MKGKRGFQKGNKEARKKGKHKATLEREIVAEAIRQRVLSNAQRLIDAQFTLAQGCSFLFVITKDEKGKREKPVLVTDLETIEAYLNGELDSNPEEYYYITTEKPSGHDIANLLDRTFGKPKETIEHSGTIKSLIVDL
jgi:hypothetical protein